MTAESINGDLGIRVSVATASMPWSPSPSPNVWRKRVHRVGPAESGQVTSVVRYDAGSNFPTHDHPDGEEILVLSGVFSDDRGDWPAGTFLLNPEGYRHAPSSRHGCELFVKLRQFPGRDREQLAVDTHAIPWTARSDGSEIRPLYSQPGYSDTMCLERWPPGYDRGDREYPTGAEMFVLDGSFSDASGSYPAGTWLRLPVGDGHSPTSTDGCTIYLKQGGQAYLISG